MPFTVFVSHTTPVSRLMELLAEKTGCRVAERGVPWKTLDTRVIAPPAPSVETKMCLIPVTEDLQSRAAMDLIVSNQSRPASTCELLAFLWTYPEEHLKYPIIARGESPDEGGPIVAYSFVAKNDRLVFIGRPSDTYKCEAGCRLLVIPMSQIPL